MWWWPFTRRRPAVDVVTRSRFPQQSGAYFGINEADLCRNAASLPVAGEDLRPEQVSKSREGRWPEPTAQSRHQRMRADAQRIIEAAQAARVGDDAPTVELEEP